MHKPILPTEVKAFENVRNTFISRTMENCIVNEGIMFVSLQVQTTLDWSSPSKQSFILHLRQTQRCGRWEKNWETNSLVLYIKNHQQNHFQEDLLLLVISWTVFVKEMNILMMEIWTTNLNRVYVCLASSVLLYISSPTTFTRWKCSSHFGFFPC